MATVNTTFGLQDKVTPVFSRMISSAAQLQAQYASLGETDPFEGVTGGGAEAALYGISGQLDEIITKIGNIPSEQNDVNDKFQSWQATVTGVNQALGLVQQGIQAIKKAADFTMGFIDAANEQGAQQRQLAVVQANQGNTRDEFQKTIDKAQELQQATTLSATAYTAAAGELSTYVKDQAALESLLDTFSDYAVGMAGVEISTQEAVNLATQLGKVTVGAFDGITKKGFELTDQQKEIIENGTDMEKALVISDVIGESWEGLAQAMRDTPQGKAVSLKNTFDEMAATVGEKLYPSYNLFLDSLVERLPDAEAAADSLANVLSSGLLFVAEYILPAVSAAFDFLRDNIEKIKLAFVILGTVAVGYGLAVAAAWVAANWPLVVLAGLFIGIISAMEGVGITAADVAGIVGKVFGFLYTFLQNIFADFWNFIAGFAEFFANVFDDPVAAIARLFVNLVDTILGLLETVASAIDFIFGSNLASTVSGWRGNLQSWVDDKFGTPEISIDRIAKESFDDNVEAWGKAAAELVDGFGDLKDTLDGAFDPTTGLMFNGDAGFDYIEEVGEVGKIKGDVSITDEDLKLLKEYATLEYINLYQTSRPVLNATFGDIRESADPEAVRQAVEDMMIEAWEANLP